ncbi:MAG TPA: NAD(P)-dependent oxidoreductase [Caulobacteraceae bacterium]|nr:NAD(P)-dependent oxidoreductase [Caulobacteraceae bacterium]
MTAIGFIGLGRMGAPMAACLAGAGHELAVLDKAEGAQTRFLGEHPAARAVQRPRDLAQESQVVITMLPASADVADVLYGTAGVLAGLKPGSLVIEMSSGAPARTQAFAADVERIGGALIDAPVSGGVARAASGELSIMVGGAAAAVERARPILLAMGTSILATGAVGTAHAMKALNNLVSAAGFMISVEALLIGKRFGLDPAVMVDVLNASTGVNNSTQKKLKPFVLSRTFDSGFALDLMVKDLTIALGIARDEGVAAPLAAQVRELWAAALAAGAGGDHTHAARFSERLAGIEL